MHYSISRIKAGERSLIFFGGNSYCNSAIVYISKRPIAPIAPKIHVNLKTNYIVLNRYR